MITTERHEKGILAVNVGLAGNALLQEMGEVQDVEEIHGHRFGLCMVGNITIGISPDLTVAQGDRIASRVGELLIRKIDLMRRVFVHYRPVRSTNLNTSLDKKRT
jgi:divalent metal cation (Fe/Co/Zn/Cd) transporter